MRGTPQIEVTFDIDANVIMNISAKDKSTGKENKITIKSDSGLSETEIQNMIREAEENAEADRKARELIDAKNSAEAQLHSVKKEFDEHSSKITLDQKSKIEDAMDSVKESIKGDDVEVINKSLAALLESAQPLMQAKAQSTQSNNSSQSDTIDAEFTEAPKTE
jgi:molecular chaperone DnaK